MLHRLAACGLQCPVSDVRCPMPGVRCPVSGVRCPVSGVRCPVSGVRRHRHTIFIARETARRTGKKPPHQAAASRWIAV
ncbi:hypothetical protein BOC51_15320 [Burkholderia pseudomallei]|nr:hypothetical protein BOC51_15320 [Burkholderia pseudomallei]